MVSVVEVDLAALGVRFPRGGVGMVLSQPYIQFTQDEPIVLLPERKQKCLQDLQSALNVSLGRHHRADRTHFTVLPEDAVPGLDGVTVIDQALASNDWPGATVVIGGVDGLTNTTYAPGWPPQIPPPVAGSNSSRPGPEDSRLFLIGGCPATTRFSPRAV